MGDAAWLLRLGSEIDVRTSAAACALAHRCAEALEGRGFEAVVAYASVALHYDATRWTGTRAWQEIRSALGAVTADGMVPSCGSGVAGGDWLVPLDDPGNAAGDRRTLVVPVSYGGADGPDLEALAAHARLDPDEVVARHQACVFQVAMIGFQPGFPYLLGLDPALAMPRLATPRARVPAGSVAIGAAQGGIYPRASPGGWRLIGRTAAVLFDPDRSPPALFRSGDRVRFVAVSADALGTREVRIV